MLAPILVTTDLDVVANDGLTSLREAISTANANVDADTITFAGAYTIDLRAGVNEELLIKNDLTIDASEWSSSGGVTITAQHGTDGIAATGDGIRIFNIEDSDGDTDVTLNGLVLTEADHGYKITDESQLDEPQLPAIRRAHGGAILNISNGELVVRNTRIHDNAAVVAINLPSEQTGAYVLASAKGGAIYSEGKGTGTLTIEENSVLENNTALVNIANSRLLRFGVEAAGGAVWVEGPGDSLQSTRGATITDSTIRANEAHVLTSGAEAVTDFSAVSAFGGGIFLVANDDLSPIEPAVLTVTNSTIDGNAARTTSNATEFKIHTGLSGPIADGGGIYLSRLGTLVVDQSTINGNTAEVSATFADGSSVLADAAEPLVVARGGGIYAENFTNTILSSTLSGNAVKMTLIDNTEDEELDSAAALGGGIYDRDGTTTISHTTIARNEVVVDDDAANNAVAFAGAGVYATATTTGPNNIDLDHTLVADNFTFDDGVQDEDDISVSNSLVRAFWSLVESGAISLNLNSITGEQGAALGLLELADNGGPTMTHALDFSSAAVDAGDPNADQGVNVPDYDQRGAVHDRVFNILGRMQAGRGPIDIGAFELQGCDLGADFDTDGDVDGDDFLTWQDNFGTQSGAEHENGDADCDGDVDGDDFLIWQAQFGSGVGAGTLFDENNAVQVVEVIISGSTSTHDPFYFSTVVGSGDQLTTVPVGGADTISIVFSEHANVGASDLHIVGLYTANAPSFVSFSYDLETMTATWKFDNWALGDQYALTLDSDSIEDAEGSALDGEWTNPAHVTTVNAAVSEFPSGDGYAGGDFAFVMTLLAGDANLDNIVDGADYLIWQANYNMNVGAQFGHADGDGDGDVDGDDFMIYQSMSGTDYAAIWILTDLDGDGDVDTDDAQIIADNMNETNVGWSGGDVNEDGIVDLDDFWLWYAQSGVNLVIAS